jgi:hypothetical protein
MSANKKGFGHRKLFSLLRVSSIAILTVLGIPHLLCALMVSGAAVRLLRQEPQGRFI